MSDLKAELVLTAKAAGLKKEVKNAVKDLKGLAKGGIVTSKNLDGIEKSSQKSVKSIKALGKDSKKLEKEFKKLGKNKLAEKFKKTTSQVNKNSSAFKAAGHAASGFKRVQDNVGRVVDATSRKIKAQTEATKRLSSAQKNASSKSFVGGGGVAGNKRQAAGGISGGKNIGGGVIASHSKKLMAGIATFYTANTAKRVFDSILGSIREVDSGKADLKSLGMKDLSAVIQTGRDLQAEYAGMYAADFIKASYDIKSGIASLTEKGVADVTAAAAITAKAAKGDTANMTSLFATAYGYFKNDAGNKDLSDKEWAEKFASVIATSVKLNKTDGSKMQQAIEAAGDGVLKLGMDMEQFIAILGTLQMTKQAGVAGTNLKAYGANLAKAEGAFSKMAQKGKNKTGVKLLNNEGKILDIEEVINNLKARYGKELDGHEMEEIKLAFGSEEAVGFVTAMWDAAKGVTSQTGQLQQVGKNGIKAAKNMAAVQDVDNIDATVKLSEQAVDLTKQQSAEAKRDDIMNYYEGKQKAFVSIADKISETGEIIGGFGQALEMAKEYIYAHSDALLSALPIIAGLAGLKVAAKTVGFAGRKTKDIITGENKAEKARAAIDRNEKRIAQKAQKIKPKAAANQNIKASKSIPTSTKTPIKNAIKTGFRMGGLATIMELHANKKQLYQNQVRGEKFRYAQDSFKRYGIDARDPMAFKTMQAYQSGNLRKDGLNLIVEKMGAAFPADKIAQLLENLSQSSVAISQNLGVANLPMNAQEPKTVNEIDQSTDQRQYIKKINVQNHITVKVTTGASPKAIGQAVGAHAAAAVQRGEALADGEF